jgi:multimeric flavodoxin WrbA
MQRKRTIPTIRKGQADWPMSRAAFEQHFRRRFHDPAFEPHAAAIDTLLEVAWENYRASRKAPRTRKAGKSFADPDYDLSIEWLQAQAAVRKAQRQQGRRATARRVLLICASNRNDKTCPGEMSKTFRLTTIAAHALRAARCTVDLLDLSLLNSDYSRIIHPCKGCVSTAMPLCHWPCSCYPNHSLGQVNDWMNEIYPRWVAAHGVLIVTPVYWYQAPSGLKLMMDRLVCADGGNPDPTTTQGKDPALAKKLELKGWDYPRHLAGRAFGVIVHGDAEGADTLRQSLANWLSDMRLVQAGSAALLDRYIGYYEPYATSHEALDRDRAIREEVRNVARSLVSAIGSIRSGRREPGADLDDPRPK